MTTPTPARPAGCLCPWEEEDPACPADHVPPAVAQTIQRAKQAASLSALAAAGYREDAERIRRTPNPAEIARAASVVRRADPQTENDRAWHVAAIRAINAVAEAYGVTLAEPDDRPTQANEPISWQAARELPMYHAGPYDQRCGIGIDGGRCVRIWDHANKGLPCAPPPPSVPTKAEDGVPDTDEIHRVADALDRVVAEYDSVACADAVGLLKALADMPRNLARVTRERDDAVARASRAEACHAESFLALCAAQDEVERLTGELTAEVERLRTERARADVRADAAEAALAKARENLRVT